MTWQAIGWTGFTLYTLTGYIATVGRAHVRAADVASIVFFDAFVFPLITHGFRGWMKKRGWLALSTRRLMPRLVAATVLIAAAVTAMVIGFIALSRGDALSVAATIGMFFAFFFAMGGWLVIYFQVLARRRRDTLERQALELSLVARDAELRALKSQLNPHFLFNSLNSVRALIADDPEGAQTAVTQLARMLRYSLGAQEELVSLDRELAIVEDYLALEALRLGERLTIARSIAADARQARIPVMLLQTLVENAIKHGIAPLPAGGTLRISAALDDGALTIVIAHPRPPEKPDPGDDTGIGLANAARRLSLLFGDRATLDLDLAEPGQATARVHIERQP